MKYYEQLRHLLSEKHDRFAFDKAESPSKSLLRVYLFICTKY